jgi:glutamate-1-semialdehyde 2,1-aminomutase
MVEVMVNTLTKEWAQRADRVLCGKQSNFRPGPSRAPIISDFARGTRITDVDGKDYIDFVLGMGPAIWGHSNNQLRDAVFSQYDRQFSSPSAVMHTTLEIELAEKIVEYVPCAQRVRFGLTGSEADQMAMRIARGATGKSKVVRFVGNYHGWLDNAFAGDLVEGEAGGFSPIVTPRTGAGIAPHSVSDMYMVPWNDLAALERLFASHGNEIALVLMEAIMCNYGCCPPREGYLEGVRKLCDEYKVLLCFDEVITGFRVAMGGAQELTGVTPDMAVFGKALAGGLPLSAIAGKAEVMDVVKENKVVGGGTFNSFPLALATGLSSMDMLAAGEFEFFKRGRVVRDRIAEGLKAAAVRYDFPLLVQGPIGFIYFAFTDLDVAYAPHELAVADGQLAMEFRECLEQAGVIIGGGSRLVTTGTMHDEDVEVALSRFDTAMRSLRERRS